ncbi:enoyl-CoA hydratase-related protein [Pontibacillus litoralis]|uniref:Enoyl-CoA hydratase n=1 Tax=Pontibacillus litoralis JSM 072002 TaxID=1385512 RepID=A0A0A5G4A6_9BACI|nr:enoyl-CoA hydratase-related protein [Pontibacillus litoralis]KGX86889.1 enoyl-CoA hydratase [Pontibacillus litoralis JSM 072002]
MSEYRFLQVTVVDGIALVELNRPDVLNAINRAMVTELVQAFEHADKDERIGVIVLTGKGRAFAAGADIDEMRKEGPIDFELADPFADWDKILRIRKPIIGAVKGFALGGGFELALACDVLFASHQAQFAFPEVNLGVMPGAGGTQQLTKIIGKKKALAYLWTGDRMTAQQAYDCDIVTRLIDEEVLLEETMKFAKRITRQPSLAIRLIKESVNVAVDVPLEEGMKQERKNFYLLFASEDQKEGMNAFVEKRPPQFKGR